MNTENRKPAAWTATTLLVALLALAAIGCGGSDSTADPGASAPDYSKAVAKAPPKLKALYAQGGKIAPGGLDAFSQQLADVKGYPVVVNNWASWCIPCRTEWPWLQQAAADDLDRVAFMGVNTDDEDAAAQTFLDGHPVPYPSFADPDKAFIDAVGATTVGGLPNTLYFDRNGELVYTHQGPYTSEAQLDADIQKYAFGES